MQTNQTDYKNFSNLSVKLEMPFDIILYGAISYCIVFLLGIVGNSLVLYVLTKEKDLRNFTNYLLANLSIADTLTLLICVPTGLHDLFAKERWYLGRLMCYLIVFAENCLGVASILSIFFITLERFYVICRPLSVKSLMTQSRTLKLVIFIWLVAVFINLPFIFLSRFELGHFYDDTYEFKCLLKVDSNNSVAYVITVSFLIYFFIGIVLIYMYCKISMQLNKSTLYIFSFSNESKSQLSQFIKNKPMAQSVVSETGHSNHEQHSSQTNSNRRGSYYKTSEGELVLLRKHTITDRNFLHSNNCLFNYIRLRRKLIFMLIIVIVAFYVCLFPLKIWNLIFMFYGHKDAFREVIKLKIYWFINITVRILFYINSSINPLLYNWLSAKFRFNFKKLIFFTKVNAAASPIFPKSNPKINN